VSKESTNRSFDDLARAVANGSLSRRRALRLFAGTAIAALIPSRALADDDECTRSPTSMPRLRPAPMRTRPNGSPRLRPEPIHLLLRR
jgi:hypothetical protein